MTAQFGIEPAQCDSESASLNIAISAKTTEGRKIDSSSFQVYVDHKYILMGSELSGLADNANPFSAAVASAANYGKMASGGSELPPIAAVPTVSVGASAVNVDTLAPGTMGCWLEHREYLCR